MLTIIDVIDPVEEDVVVNSYGFTIEWKEAFGTLYNIWVRDENNFLFLFQIEGQELRLRHLHFVSGRLTGVLSEEETHYREKDIRLTFGHPLCALEPNWQPIVDQNYLNVPTQIFLGVDFLRVVFGKVTVAVHCFCTERGNFVTDENNSLTAFELINLTEEELENVRWKLDEAPKRAAVQRKQQD